jgi:hypothetical protein
MQKYMAANNGLLPEDLVQLKPYFDSPIDENVLRRYATFSYSAKASDLPREAILAMEVAAPADDEYDTLYQYRLNGKRFGSVNPDISALLSATLDFARANNGQIPSDHTQLLAYLKHPVDQQLAQTFLKLMPANALLHLQ